MQYHNTALTNPTYSAVQNTRRHTGPMLLIRTKNFATRLTTEVERWPHHHFLCRSVAQAFLNMTSIPSIYAHLLFVLVSV